jgi:hypothetical protein
VPTAKMTDHHHKAAAVKAAGRKAVALSQARTYRPNPLLVKPGKRTRQEALPTALHMSICVGFSLLVFAIINICVTEILGKRNPFTALVQSGTMVRSGSWWQLPSPSLHHILASPLNMVRQPAASTRHVVPCSPACWSFEA